MAGAAYLSIAPALKMFLHTAVIVNSFVLRDAFHVRSVILHSPLLVTRPECSEWYISAVSPPWGNVRLCGASNHPEGRERSHYHSQCSYSIWWCNQNMSERCISHNFLFIVILPKDPVPGYFGDYSKNTDFVRM